MRGPLVVARQDEAGSTALHPPPVLERVVTGGAAARTKLGGGSKLGDGGRADQAFPQLLRAMRVQRTVGREVAGLQHPGQRHVGQLLTRRRHAASP